MDEFDTQRIAIVGGSAGGYSALMLSALQMGNCTTIATSPIANVYFNFYQYFQMANRKDAPFFLIRMTPPDGKPFPLWDLRIVLEVLS